MTDRKLYRYKDAAEVMGISVATLKRAITSGQLIPVMGPGMTGKKGLRLSGIELDRYIRGAAKRPPTMRQWRKMVDEAEAKREQTG